MDYYSRLPNEIKEYIQNIIKKDTIKKLQKFRIKNREEKKKLLYKLMWDLSERNNCWIFKEPIIGRHRINHPYIECKNIINTNDLYTEKILYIINDLINVKEFFRENSIISFSIWNKFLWAISMGIWYNINNNLYTISENLYCSLRTKTVQGAKLNSEINLFNLAPSLI